LNMICLCASFATLATSETSGALATSVQTREAILRVSVHPVQLLAAQQSSSFRDQY
jgi:hypothetical protein